MPPPPPLPHHHPSPTPLQAHLVVMHGMVTLTSTNSLIWTTGLLDLPSFSTVTVDL